MSEENPHSEPAPKLRCLAGAEAPEELLARWRVFESIPGSARSHIWEVLAQVVVHGSNDEATRCCAEFCRQHGLEPVSLDHSVAVCHFLLSQAARVNLDLEGFRADLEALSGEGGQGALVLTLHYEEMLSILRRQILEGSLLDHGKVFTGLDWRVDLVGASDRGLGIDAPVALLTLRHQQGVGDAADRGRVSLYLVPEAVSQLRQVCEQIEGMLASGPSGRVK